MTALLNLKKMELSRYVNKKVKVELPNNYFYEGRILKEDGDSIQLRDREGKVVTISKKSILFIREVKNG